MNKRDPLKNIVFISLPDSIETGEDLPIDPSILLPIEIDPDHGYADITNLSWEMIIAAALKILAHNPGHDYADYYRELIPAIKPDVLSELTTAAVIKAGEKDYDIAEEIFLSLTNLCPDDFGSRLNLALLYEERADAYLAVGKEDLSEEYNDLAFQTYKTLVAKHPSTAEGHFNFGLFYLKGGSQLKAVEHLESFLANSSDKKKNKKVKEILEQLNKKQSTDELFLKAYDAIKMGKEDEGIESIKDYIQTYPDVWNAWFLLGWAYRRKGMFREGAEAFQKALDLGSDQIDLYNEMAICLMETERLDESKACLLTALKHEPENIKILSNFGIVSLKMEDPESAKTYFKKVLEINPDDKIAIEYLSKL